MSVPNFKFAPGSRYKPDAQYRKHARDETPESEAYSSELSVVDESSKNGYRPEKRPRTHRSLSLSAQIATPQYLIIHRVACSHGEVMGEDHKDHPRSADYLDAPRLFANDTRGSALRGRRRIVDLDEHLENNPEVCLVVYKHYSCTAYHRGVRDSFETLAAGNVDRQVFNRFRPWFFSLKHDGELARPTSENIVLVSESLQGSMVHVANSDREHLAEWDSERNLNAPFDYFYHFRTAFREVCENLLGPIENLEVEVLLNYIDEAYGSSFEKADEMFRTGNVSQAYFTKLFAPNQIVVARQGEHIRAYVVDHFPDGDADSLELECWSWAFDGKFRKVYESFSVHWPDSDLSIVPISSLYAWPLALDMSGSMKARLDKRGRDFWSCRHRRFVSYEAPTQTVFEIQTTNPRYMIDFNTYKQMHPKNFPPAENQEVEQNQSGIDLSSDTPPEGRFCILLPPTILGYGFHDKKWRSLSLEHIREVPWNTDAFNHRLVLKKEKKELIKALVTVHLATNQSADVVEGKGNGLIILLHGSPGTGKTLTAESVAELAKKPLYRVTCGDIGTDAESVEKYLESVLLIGTIWGCVVLLDEADIFLEERATTDLARNALVSVFLRVLEYYEGILILTSNRVGTFDEAFKSRVQLAVHYPTLDEEGRLKIWTNFIHTLRTTDILMNFEELDRHVRILAVHKLNGRQIRNLVWTARQLAKYRKERLEYTHLEQVIEIANEFEKYLVDTHGHTDEAYARAQGTRIS